MVHYCKRRALSCLFIGLALWCSGSILVPHAPKVSGHPAMFLRWPAQVCRQWLSVAWEVQGWEVPVLPGHHYFVLMVKMAKRGNKLRIRLGYKLYLHFACQYHYKCSMYVNNLRRCNMTEMYRCLSLPLSILHAWERRSTACVITIINVPCMRTMSHCLSLSLSMFHVCERSSASCHHHGDDVSLLVIPIVNVPCMGKMYDHVI